MHSFSIVAKRANAAKCVALSDVPNHVAKPFALFLLGLTDVQLRRFNDAEALLTSFVGSQPRKLYRGSANTNRSLENTWPILQDILKWREQHGSAKTITEMSRALSSLQDLIGRLQKIPPFRLRPCCRQKTLAARLRRCRAARTNRRRETASGI